MLVLSRKKGEKIVIVLPDENITVEVIEIRSGDKVRLGIEAPRSIPVHRQEVHAEMTARREAQTEKQQAASAGAA